MKSRRITVRGIVFNNDATLLCQQLKQNSQGEPIDYWCIPGGGLDPGESLHAGLHREMVEETGIAPIIGELLFVQQYHTGDKEFLEFFFHIKNPKDYTVIDLASTTHGLLEIEKTEFLTPNQHNIMPEFLQTIDILEHINSKKPTYISNRLPQ